MLADSGYVSEENFARADQDKLRLLAPPAKDPTRPGEALSQEGQAPGPVPATARAIRRMRHPRGPRVSEFRGE